MFATREPYPRSSEGGSSHPDGDEAQSIAKHLWLETTLRASLQLSYLLLERLRVGF